MLEADPQQWRDGQSRLKPVGMGRTSSLSGDIERNIIHDDEVGPNGRIKNTNGQEGLAIGVKAELLSPNDNWVEWNPRSEDFGRERRVESGDEGLNHWIGQKRQ